MVKLKQHSTQGDSGSVSDLEMAEIDVDGMEEVETGRAELMDTGRVMLPEPVLGLSQYPEEVEETAVVGMTKLLTTQQIEDLVTNVFAQGNDLNRNDEDEEEDSGGKRRPRHKGPSYRRYIDSDDDDVAGKDKKNTVNEKSKQDELGGENTVNVSPGRRGRGRNGKKRDNGAKNVKKKEKEKPTKKIPDKKNNGDSR
ncbi:hypothetical protein NDU88_002257 [Pleurodeles waltl]|uniref:Uncharacterized protein n=1 Tax=Pleurodeles waltl TaxID=8319 RepID=A0AAV7W1D0_PLEWA|nr:hypothetical protein NDU88_002257 [Pleurodeles waltl]